MILWHAWLNIIWTYTFYFSHGLVVLLSLPVAVVRPIQVLHKGSLRGFLAPAEIIVELLRLLQYCVILTIGMNFVLLDIFGHAFWGRILLRLEQLHWTVFFYQFIGFVIVFSILNLILFMIILRKSTVAVLMEKYRNKIKSMNQLEVSTVRTAAMLAIKNMLVIPVSVIYLFHILNLI